MMRTLTMRRIVPGLLVLLWSAVFATAAHAGVTARLDRSDVQFGDTVTLNVEADSVGSAEPDFSPLADKFRLLGTSSNSQISLVNGRQTMRTLWAVALEPLEPGVITIPALTVGNEQTTPLVLTVRPAPAGANGQAGSDVFVEVEALPTSPYVQQQVSYTVRLFYAVTLLEGVLEEPQMSDVRVMRLGSDETFQRVVGGRRYQVVQRRYALIPERSGAVDVPSPRFSGRVLDRGAGSMFGGGRRVASRGDAVKLDVKQRPASSAEPWLPAHSLTLTDDSDALPAELKVGEPLTLTLRLRAEGLAPEQLPELTLPPIQGAQVYPDQETSQSQQGGEWLAGERTRKFAIVPAVAGALQIPAVRIRWWNTQTDREETAVIPARTVQVLPAARTPGTADAPSAPPQPAAEPSAPAPTSAAPVLRDRWPWIAASVFALLWLLTLAWALRRRQAPVALPHEAPAAPPAVAPALRDALRSGDPATVAQALRGSAPPAMRTSLEAIADGLADRAQQDAVRDLERALYGGAPDPALVQKLRAAFGRAPQWAVAANAGRREEALPTLYG